MTDTIKILVDFELFMAVCTKKPRANNFTQNAMKAIFDKMVAMSVPHEILPIDGWLQSAREEKSSKLVARLTDLSYSNTEALIEAGKGIDFGSEQLSIDYNDDSLYSEDIWEAHQTLMLENDIFIVKAASILARADQENYTKLKNGNWISFI